MLLTSGMLAALLVIIGGSESRDTAPLPETESAAGSTYLCTGYAGCRSAGYSDAGYGARNHRMYWRMYSGHNCTNYAAYRMIRAGMPNQRPWSGGGNASEWGKYMRRITDGTPRVGSIAWWGRYEGGHGSAGHVAYVERVENRNTIVISEDAWGGNFHWRRITRDSGRWPSGFVHFVNNKSIENVKRPSIRGAARIGEQLRVGGGAWKPSRKLKGSFQWYAGGEAIPGATSRRFTVERPQYGKRITARITASRQGFQPATAVSRPTKRVDWGRYAVSAPTIDGTAEVGRTLTFEKSPASPTPDKYVVKWRADGKVIRGSRNRPLKITSELLGRRITAFAVVNGIGFYKRELVSEPTAPVVQGEVRVTTPTRIKGGRRVGQLLRAVPGTVSPSAGVTTSYQWLRNGTPIDGATGATYRLAPADVGSRVRVQVRHSKDDFTPAVEHANGSRLVRTDATVRVKVRTKGRRAVVRVRVTAPGVDAVQGRLYVGLMGRDRTVWIRNGRAREEFFLLDRGTWWARAHFRPTTLIRGDREKVKVRIRY
jgi:surface antigen